MLEKKKNVEKLQYVLWKEIYAYGRKHKNKKKNRIKMRKRF